MEKIDIIIAQTNIRLYYFARRETEKERHRQAERERERRGKKKPLDAIA